ncbi:hypothetical protein DRP07_00165 [Archaeoglobales archaeon]|mgnify:CR=1 FL=1|nr:MAG: hypothetical protein DRP07_00165 [Archaeoglobales archaeon]
MVIFAVGNVKNCCECGKPVKDNWVRYMGKIYCRECFKDKFKKFGTISPGLVILAYEPKYHALVFGLMMLFAFAYIMFRIGGMVADRLIKKL